MVPMQVNGKNPFQCNLTAVWKDIPQCSFCSGVFSTKWQNKISRRPMILDCFHNACECCFFSNREITCKKCQVVTRIDRRRPIRETHEFNYHLIGFIGYYEHAMHKDILPSDILPHRSVETVKGFQVWCAIHKNKINYYCETCDSIFCYKCIQKDHKSHSTTPIWEENKKYESKITSLIETTKMAKQRCKKTQREIKQIEKTYENYALNTIDAVSNYFLILHAKLQKQEKKILMDIKNNVEGTINRMNILHATITQSAKTFEELLKLMQNSDNKEKHLYAPEIINRAQSGLKDIPCCVDFENNMDDPFKFMQFNNHMDDIQDYVDLNFEEVQLKPQMRSYYEIINAPALKENENPKQGVMGSQSSIFTLVQDLDSEQPASQKVHISCIKTPLQFFVQSEIFLSKFEEFKNLCSEEGGYASMPDSIEINETYLICNVSDKTWYRAKVLAVKEDKFEVSLIDDGNKLDVPQKRFREISEDLRIQPPGAFECSIFGIKSKSQKLDEEAKNLIVEIVNNQIVDMLTLMTSNSVNFVDIIVPRGKYKTSLRDALIYADLVEQQELCEELKQNFATLQNKKKILLSGEKQCFYRHSFKYGENFSVTVLHVDHPQEFYVIKNDHKADRLKMQREFNEEYEKPQQKLFGPQPGTPCAVFISGNWFRARYLKSLGKGNNKIRLVDYGYAEIVHWKQIRVLSEKFLNNSEFAFQCSLTDIEPLQENDYTWTDEATAEFKRMTKNPGIQIFIHRSKDFRYKVVLLMIKPRADVNINAKLVYLKHAIATGPEALCMIISKNQEGKEKRIVNTEKIATQEIADNQIKKEPVKISHIVSPGEFYIKKVEHLDGIARVHNKIQQTQLPTKDTEIIEWKKNDKCLVYASIRPDTCKQWYRGIIQDVDTSENDALYTVFLCDDGNQVSNIPPKQLAKISVEDSRICNGVITCHMACVQPTGGLNTWSYSSIDEFKTITKKYNSFEATIQGKRYERSIPIVLWGMTTEFTGPLSPSISKWININKSMVNCGLAHLTEKFDPNLQTEVMNYGLLEGEETIEKWIENCNAALENHDYEDVEETSTLDFKSITPKIEKTLKAWLPSKPIEKQIFKAYITYIDNQGTIYGHDFENHDFLEKMKYTMQLRADDLKIDENYNWQIGQTCLARFHLDGKFYRAVVRKIKSEKEMSVTFVDYGNTEDVSTKDVSFDTMLPEIQIMSNKFEIDQIGPADGTDVWPISTLDFIHAQIVGKVCTIRLIPNQENQPIQKCSIRFESFDIAQLLLNNKMAISRLKRNLNRHESPDINVSANKNLSEEDDSDDDYIIEPSKSPELDQLNDAEYKKMFEKKELENLFNSDFVLSGEDSAEEDIESVLKYRTGYWNQCNNEDVHTEILDSSSSSTTTPSVVSDATASMTTSRIKGLNKFLSPVIPQGVLKFYAEISLISNSCSLYLSPFLTEHQQSFSDMSNQLQIAAKNAKPLLSFDPDTICLAVYTADKLWYRAIIRSYSEESNTVDVLFVDFLNAETVPTELVRKFPKHLLKYSLRNIFVTLSGIKANIRWREADIQKKLSILLSEHDKIFVRIIKPGRIPEVELYASQDADTVIYNELIQDKFYLQRK